LTDQQLYLAIGVPTLAVLIGILVGVGQSVVTNSRITSLENRLDGRIDSLDRHVDARITSLETRIDTKFEILVGKVIDVDNRMVRLEERLKH
jgi:hypothetical protein